jgi:NAD(P)-dependent dehydrogenase (short-subunit alcohol dehydrogenase family)
MANNITDLSDRVAVVVGGTSGLGCAVALGLAESGADVVATGRRATLVKTVADRIAATGRRTLVHETDVTSRASIDALRDEVLRQLGRVDILVNAAGRTLRKQTKDVGEPEWNMIMDTNLTGMLRACQSFHEPLKASGHGRIINIASLASFVGFWDVGVYNASKMGVRSLTQTLAIEWARDAICVNAIAPGIFPTEINRAVLEGTERGKELLLRTPMRRFGRVEELAGAVVFLASDAASFVTGTTLAVDGGFLCCGVSS